MPFERPATVNEPSDKFPAQSFAVRDGSKTLDFDLSALAIDGSWTFPAPAAGDAGKVLFGDGTWQSIPGGGDMLGSNNLSDLANAGTARTNLGLGSLATLSTIGTAQITDSAVTDVKINTVSGSKVSGDITGNAANVTGTVAVLNGGTGATTQSGARTNLGLGSLAVLSTVGTSQITDSAVTDAKIDTVAASKITGTIGAAQITDSAVTDAKIDTVAATKITGTIATAQIANSAVTDAKISAVAATKITGTIATAQIANSAVTDAKIDTMTASKLTGSIAPARVGVTVDKTLPYNNAGTLAGSNIILDGTGGRSLWIAQDDAGSFFRIGSNLNIFTWLRNDGHNYLRTLNGNALYINDNSDATTNIATGTGNTTLGNTTGTTAVYGSTLTIQGTTLKINVGSDAAGDTYYRDASGNFVRLPKGTDGQVLTLASGLPSWAAAGGGVTGFTGSQNTSSPNDTVNASRLLVSASSTNADFVAQPKGTGAILAQLPDSTATGGNKRGDYAVDLQMIRSSASQVASGSRSFTVGQGNTASGTYTSAIGLLNVSSGTNSVALGAGNESSAYSSVSLGSYGKAYIDGQVSFGVIAQTSPSTTGLCQSSIVTLCANTTNATPTLMKAADTFSSFAQIHPVVNSNCTIHFVAKIIGKSSGGDVATFMRDGVIKNISGTTSLVGSIGTIGTDRSDAGLSSCTVAITANDTTDRLDVEITGVSSTTIRWTCTLIYTEVTL